ncbi:hypothetical protein B0H67DRAFT_595098 [Lasiosphaeris hirsuta]|uniref:Uncharacterized protein n=1 Tax=Lasiosphaeris hirsuta TaxID=260670 RepID=A0AA40DK40_9PEZI|nr:hypothetical protein B0H67DRAFT_595098 [Lasiosphaeris hirsuta]
MAESVADDMAFLDLRASALSERCSDTIAAEMNAVTIAEARKRLTQSRRTEILTVLTFIFVPLSFVLSFFGMNVDVFEEPGQPLMRFFQVAVPITAVCVAVPLWPWIFKTWG